MERRAFLKKAGLGSIALGSASGLASMLAIPASASDRKKGNRQSTFVAVSQAQTVGGVQHRVAMNGKVRFSPEKQRVSGGGSFVHFNNAPPGTPKPILASGLWEAEEFISWDHNVGTYDHINASILQLGITLLPDGGVATEAVLRLICNIGPAGLSTGEEEGFVLTIPGALFGPFRPLVPPLGLTHISTADGG